MLFGHLRAAYGEAPQPAVLYQLARKEAFGALKGRACACKFKRLLISAPAHKLVHFAFYLRFVALLQLKDRIADDSARLHNAAVAV